MTTNRIGEFDFLYLRGVPGTVREEVLVMARAGVDGVAIWKTGHRGGVFTILSGVDAPTFDDARRYLTEYQKLIGSDPVAMTWGGLEMAGEDFQVAVKSVKPAGKGIIPIAASTGGINPPSEAFIECEWELVPIDTSPPEE